MSKLISVQDIAAKTGEQPHIIRYACRRYGPEPEIRTHNTVLYREEDLPAIQAALDKTARRSTDAQRKSRHNEEVASA